MAVKNLYTIIIVRVLLITVTSIGFSYFLMKSQINYSLYFLLLIVIQVIFLIRFLNNTNRNIAYFFNSVENEDSTIHFPEKSGPKSVKELNKSINRVNKLIQKVKIQIQVQEKYYQTIIEHSTIGMMTINAKGHIILANSAIKKILNYENLTHLQQLKRVDVKLYQIISQLKPFDQRLILLPNERENVQLTIKASSLKLKEETILLVIIQNIHNELDDKEIDSWIRLVRVLSHEIMNAIAPITSLSETLSEYYRKEDRLILPEEIKSIDIENTVKGLNIIQSQGNDLMNFVSSYRSLTKMPIPEKKIISVQHLLEKIRILVSKEKGFDRVKFEIIIIPKNLEVYADEKQLDQVLVNLVKNALQSLNGDSNGVIQLLGEKDDPGKLIIKVTDNGPGVPPDLLDKIFIPFFTTRENGSGIGLSLSKHIMRIHGGSLKVESILSERTSFILRF